MKKVAIVNRTNLKNYGSVLQCCALCGAVESLGYEAEIIWETGNLSENYDFRINKILKTGLKLLTHPGLMKATFSSVKYVQQQVISEKTIKFFDSFVENNIRRVFYPSKMMHPKKIGQKYDKFICGSDQVWCTTSLYVDPLMYLRFAPKKKRIAYAPSLGRDYIPKYNRRQIRKYITEIPAVSVRESVGKGLIAELTGRNVPVVLDPTLLVERTFWDSRKALLEEREDYILCYFLSTPTMNTQNKIFNFLRGQRKKVVALNSRLEYLEKEIEVIYPDCGPSEFITYVENAESVLTDSYHGMLFCIIYHKTFWSIKREYGEYDQSSRQMSILSMLNLKERYCDTEDLLIQKKIDYIKVEEILNKERIKSLKYLRGALEND